MSSLSQNDQLALEQHGLSISQLELQLQQLRQGVPPLNLVRPCHVGDGIIQFSPKELNDYRKQFQIAHAKGRISKFIPASGAGEAHDDGFPGLLDQPARLDVEVPRALDV